MYSSIVTHKVPNWLRAMFGRPHIAPPRSDIPAKTLPLLDLVDREHVLVYEDEAYRSYVIERGVATDVNAEIGRLYEAGCVVAGEWGGPAGAQRRNWSITALGVTALAEADRSCEGVSATAAMS